MQKIQKLTNWLGKEKLVLNFISILLMVQPLLDVLSYFLLKTGDTTLTTILRTIMFAGIVLYTFLISENKKVYYIFYGIAGVYWILHMVNCFRIGYQSPVSDCANFLRAVQMPALTISFITLFKKSSRMSKRIQIGFLINIVIILAVIALSYLTGMPEYTYGNYLKVGVLGWFGIANAQSVIVMLLVPLALYFVYTIRSKLFFLIASIACFGLLFFTGTRLTFYSIFIVAAAFIFLMGVNCEKRWSHYAILFVVLVSGIAFAKDSPMYQRNQMQMYSFDNYQENISDSNSTKQQLGSTTKEETFFKSETENLSEAKNDLTNEVTTMSENAKDLNYYESVYRSLANGFLSNMIDRFGIERVAEAYDYSMDTAVLLNNRTKKLVYAKLSWEQQDFLTKCLGYEYATLLTDSAADNYSPENDFHSLFYFFGYAGIGMYFAYIAYFIIIILKQMRENLRQVFTMECGIICSTFALLLGAAYFTGYVFLRPNVSIYLSIILAYIYYLFKHHSDTEKLVSSIQGD